MESIKTKRKRRFILKKSADSGNPKAMVKYGEMLLNGDGVPRNEKLAAFYFKLAADQGIPDAMMCYVEMCKSEATVYYEKFAMMCYVKMTAEKGNEKAKQFCDEEAKLIGHSDSNDENDDHFTSSDLSQFCISKVDKSYLFGCSKAP